MTTIKNILRFLFFLAIGMLFIWLSLKDLNREQINSIFNSFRIANYNWILLSFLIGLISHIARALRWRMLLEPLGYYPRLINVGIAVMIGYFANLALPRLGEVTRCGSLRKYENVSFTQSFGTVITERVFDMLTFFLLFFINLFMQYRQINEYFHEKIYTPISEKYSNIDVFGYLLYGGMAILIFLLLFIFVFHKRIKHFSLYKKIMEKVISFRNGIFTITKVKKPWLFVVYTIIIWGGYFLSTYVCLYCFDFTSGFGLGTAMTILVFGTIGVMITPGGIGAYTFIVAGVLINIYNLPAVEANAFGWLVWSAQTFLIIILGVISILILSPLNKRSTTAKTIINS